MSERQDGQGLFTDSIQRLRECCQGDAPGQMVLPLVERETRQDGKCSFSSAETPYLQSQLEESDICGRDLYSEGELLKIH